MERPLARGAQRRFARGLRFPPFFPYHLVSSLPLSTTARNPRAANAHTAAKGEVTGKTRHVIWCERGRHREHHWTPCCPTSSPLLFIHGTPPPPQPPQPACSGEVQRTRIYGRSASSFLLLLSVLLSFLLSLLPSPPSLNTIRIHFCFLCLLVCVCAPCRQQLSRRHEKRAPHEVGNDRSGWTTEGERHHRSARNGTEKKATSQPLRKLIQLPKHQLRYPPPPHTHTRGTHARAWHHAASKGRGKSRGR